MSLSVVHSRASIGIYAEHVTVESHISNGLPTLTIVGLPEAEVKESRERVRSALLNTHFDFPTRRITINLAPADLPKAGGRFDLPIALGILAASNQIPKKSLHEYEFIGELALSGELRPVKGILSFALAARKAGHKIILPQLNADEASLAGEITILPAKHILDVCSHLTGQKLLQPHQFIMQQPCSTNALPDLSEVLGQPHAKRALEIAAAGGHSLLFIGPPGTGKTMLASRLPGLLPPLTEEEALEIAVLTSISSYGFNISTWKKRPFRAPHHTASSVALVGGGSPPRPGEISLAHGGVLFLDELPEFNRYVLEALREPLESGTITISRAARQAEFPAKFQLVAAMNPCPCGYFASSDSDRCCCSEEQVKRYRAKLSGPLLDRVDMHIEVPTLPSALLTQKIPLSETSDQVRQRVQRARQRQHFNKLNSYLSGQELEKCCQLNDTSRELLKRAIQKLKFSARAFHRILRIARTIADLANSDFVSATHIMEAITYRKLEKAVL